ncbi:D-alanyl-D-alanine dipeptidase [Legionella lansingensis]|uniref:D-alanyl-D-alanine dipeptidase n=1 Tax=Legionella lansingensis TaxID=45067 RepID=A0A0W0VQW7_9GAMM|nr:M15 family metallopeptidase [Legionella lansingensis]KTD22086.1 D-alanyl-D-alanine dipeptidase [Legionella lansingensis]SNV45918.1 D-alanyl-D-alanine dipeptidase [Legionella lansingensis]
MFKTQNMTHDFSKRDHETVEFSKVSHPRIKIRPMYFEQGLSSYPYIFGRYAVLDRLLGALSFLPENYGFLVWDVYRPRGVQRKLFELFSEKIRRASPHLSEQEHLVEVLKYVASPAKIGESYCSPHLSGGAIDLTLFEMKEDKELDMGTVFDDYTQRAGRDYFALKTDLTAQERVFQERRNLLRQTMERVGFTSYEHEWWHFDIGNIFWGDVVKKPAVFGPLFGDEEWPSFV